MKQSIWTLVTVGRSTRTSKTKDRSTWTSNSNARWGALEEFFKSHEKKSTGAAAILRLTKRNNIVKQQ